MTAWSDNEFEDEGILKVQIEDFGIIFECLGPEVGLNHHFIEFCVPTVARTSLSSHTTAA